MSNHQNNYRRRRAVSVGAAAAIIAVTAIAIVSSGATAASSPANIGAAAKELARYQAIPKFKAPGPPFDAKKIMKGKLIVAIPVISANPFTTEFEAAQAAVAKKIGFKYVRWNNQGTVAEWSKGIDYAINQKAALIALDGGSQPRLLGPQIAKARKAGIIVVDTHETDVPQGKSPYVNFTIPAPYTESGKLMADFAIVDKKGDVNALILYSSDVIGSPPFVKSIQRTFAKYCPSCKTTAVDVPVAKWASGIGPAITGAVARDPKLNYVIPIYDPMTQFVVPALRQVQKLGTIHVSTYAGTPFVFKEIEQGHVHMDVSENLNWVGYAMLDDEMRLIGGLKPVFPEYIALRTITAKNVGKNATTKQLYGTDVENGWMKLWGLAK